jgi:hypothetical protein
MPRDTFLLSEREMLNGRCLRSRHQDACGLGAGYTEVRGQQRARDTRGYGTTQNANLQGIAVEPGHVKTNIRAPSRSKEVTN